MELEIRTVAGPISAVQCVLSGGPYTVIAGAAGPRGVPAAVTKTGDVADEDLVGAEGVAVGASVWGLVLHLPSTARTS